MQHSLEATRQKASIGLWGRGESPIAGPAERADRSARVPSGVVARFLGLVGIDADWLLAALDDVLVDDDLDHVGQVGQIEHGIEQDRLDDRTQPAGAGLALDRLLCDRDQRVVGEGQADLLQVEQFLVLLDQRILGLAENLDQRVDVEVLRSEEITSELQSLMCISYAVFCLILENLYTHDHNLTGDIHFYITINTLPSNL